MAQPVPEALYAKYTESETGEFLSSLPTAPEKTFEDSFLDFKSGTSISPDNMKKIWSKAIGAMANAGGGVVVWGLDARKDKTTDIDAVHSDNPVPNVEAFYTKLTEAERDATDPPLSGIRKFIVKQKKGSADGYIVCLIPEGPHKPYESRYAPKQYHLRAGDSSPPMPRSILQQLFHPRYHARIKIVSGERSIIHPRYPANSQLMDSYSRAEIKVVLRNAGHVSLSDGILRISRPNGMRLWFNDPIRAPSPIEFKTTKLNLPSLLHPDEEKEIVFFAQNPFDVKDLLHFTLFARDMMPKEAIVSLKWDQTRLHSFSAELEPKDESEHPSQ